MSIAPVFWFTGLSGAGKTTLADGLRQRLEDEGYHVAVLDGDSVRETLHRHLGFSAADIRENNALIAGLCLDQQNTADIVLVPIISPFADSRARARAMIGETFQEVYIKARLSTVATRDVKGLYAKARRGEIDNLVGVGPDVPYEPPGAPELILDTETESPVESAARLYRYVRRLLPVRARQDG